MDSIASMRIAVVVAVAVLTIAGVTVAFSGCGSDPLTDDDVHDALNETGYPVRYLETGYLGSGAVVAADIRQGHRHGLVLVASDVEMKAARDSVDLDRGPGSSIGIGEDAGDNDLHVWVSDGLSPGAFWDVVDALCKARLDDDERCEGI